MTTEKRLPSVWNFFSYKKEVAFRYQNEVFQEGRSYLNRTVIFCESPIMVTSLPLRKFPQRSLSWREGKANISQRQNRFQQKKWRLKSGCRNSILTTRRYTGLGSSSDWMKGIFILSEDHPDLGSDTSSVWNLCVRHFAGKPVVASQNVGWFLRLEIRLVSEKYRTTGKIQRGLRTEAEMWEQVLKKAQKAEMSDSISYSLKAVCFKSQFLYARSFYRSIRGGVICQVASTSFLASS